MSGALREIRFSIYISPEEMEVYYAGAATVVHAVGDDGRTVQFPARVVRPYVTHAGVSGRFVLRYDAAGRFHSIERIA